MTVSRDTLTDEAEATGFRPEVLKKVIHLLNLLEGFNRHPFLKGRWALKGGTALNLFLLNVPRLSVDIDLNYIGAVDRDTMTAERPKFEQAMQSVCAREGMHVARVPDDHAGGKWRLSDWAAGCALALRPLYDLLVRDVLQSRVIHTDDTPVDVLEPGRGTTRTGRFWVYRGDADHPGTVFSYTPSRSRDGPMSFLKAWGQDRPRYLQADAFGGYDGIYRGEAGGQVTEVACWAHARRKFCEARATDGATSTQALAYIRLLYDVEDQAQAQAQFASQGSAAGAGARPLAALRVALRQELAAPRLREFRGWLESRRAEAGGPVLPKSPMGQAIVYALNQWEALTVYPTDGDLAINNNAAENALRRIAVGRKNWLFCGSDPGGVTAAVLFSLIATCERHEVNCFNYLRDVLTRIAAHPMKALADLLPYHWRPAAAPTSTPTPAPTP